MDDLLFDIPIYLRSPEEYEIERQNSEYKLKKDWGSDYALGKKIEVQWPPWEYNDIIGYYKILINASPSVHGSYHGITVEKYIANKRINRNSNQRNIKIWLGDPWFHARIRSCHNKHMSLKDILLKVLDALNEDTVKRKRKARSLSENFLFFAS